MAAWSSNTVSITPFLSALKSSYSTNNSSGVLGRYSNQATILPCYRLAMISPNGAKSVKITYTPLATVTFNSAINSANILVGGGF